MKPDQEGNVEVTFDSSKYSSCMILALDEKSSTQQIIDIKDIHQVEKRTLVLDKPLTVDKYYNEVRNCDWVKLGETVTIDDITSTEHIIIDSIDKVKKV